MPRVVAQRSDCSARIRHAAHRVVGVVSIDRGVRLNRRLFGRQPPESVVGHRSLLTRAARPRLCVDTRHLVERVVSSGRRPVDAAIPVQVFTLHGSPQHVRIDFLFSPHLVSERDDLAARAPAPAVAGFLRRPVNIGRYGRASLPVVGLLAPHPPRRIVARGYPRRRDLRRIRLLHGSPHHIILDELRAVAARTARMSCGRGSDAPRPVEHANGVALHSGLKQREALDVLIVSAIDEAGVSRARLIRHALDASGAVISGGGDDALCVIGRRRSFGARRHAQVVVVPDG